MAQFIDLEKYKINGTDYYYLCGKCLELSTPPTNFGDGEVGYWSRLSTIKTFEQELRSLLVGEDIYMPGEWRASAPGAQKLLHSGPIWDLP